MPVPCFFVPQNVCESSRGVRDIKCGNSAANDADLMLSSPLVFIPSPPVCLQYLRGLKGERTSRSYQVEVILSLFVMQFDIDQAVLEVPLVADAESSGAPVFALALASSICNELLGADVTDVMFHLG